MHLPKWCNICPVHSVTRITHVTKFKHITHFIHTFYCTGYNQHLLCSGFYSWKRSEADDAGAVCPAAHRYGWSVDSGGSWYTEPGVTGGFEASAAWLQEITEKDRSLKTNIFEELVSHGFMKRKAGGECSCCCQRNWIIEMIWVPNEVRDSHRSILIAQWLNPAVPLLFTLNLSMIKVCYYYSELPASGESLLWRHDNCGRYWLSASISGVVVVVSVLVAWSYCQFGWWLCPFGETKQICMSASKLSTCDNIP